MVEIFERCSERGFVLPWIVCSVSPNGSVCVTRIHGSGKAGECLAEHYEAKGFRLPMTIAIVDQRNEAARVTLWRSGEKTWH
jgi:hypothetical protein